MFINKVQLLTNNLLETKDFYCNTLGFQLLKNESTSFTLKIGSSELEFCLSESDKEPFYHFAFNIPRNTFQEAKRWAQEKVILNVEDGEDEIFFDNIHAYSFYFTDPSGNIVEFIARRDMSEDTLEPFTVHSILNIGEINLTTKDVGKVGEELIHFGIGVRDYNKLHDGLNFLGDAGAYVLLGPPERRWIFSEKGSEIFPVLIEINKEKRIEMDAWGRIKLTYF